MPHRATPEALEFLSQQEGLVLHPYADSVGHATIGVGHLLHFGPPTAADRARWAGFTRADALKLLRKDVAKFENAINKVIDVELNDNQYAATLSLAFNIGTSKAGFAGSTVLRKINAEAWEEAADAFLMWRRPSELLPRRKRERSLFLKPCKPADPLAVLTASERELVTRYDTLKEQDVDRPQRVLLREAMRTQRKKIWRAAQETGWEKANRRARWEILNSRS